MPDMLAPPMSNPAAVTARMLSLRRSHRLRRIPSIVSKRRTGHWQNQHLTLERGGEGRCGATARAPTLLLERVHQRDPVLVPGAGPILARGMAARPQPPAPSLGAREHEHCQKLRRSGLPGRAPDRITSLIGSTLRRMRTGLRPIGSELRVSKPRGECTPPLGSGKARTTQILYDFALRDVYEC